jgi:hypothetical protein
MYNKVKIAVVIIACVMLFLSLRSWWSLGWMSAHAESLSASWFNHGVFESEQYRSWLAAEKYPPNTNGVKLVTERLDAAGLLILANVFISAVLLIIAICAPSFFHRPATGGGTSSTSTATDPPASAT